MATNMRQLNATPEAVFRVLADGWLYASWVVGASRVRAVDDEWPAAGAQLAHSFGSWPLVIDDRSVLLEWDPPRRMKLRARGWPIGEAEVIIEAKPRGAGCVVRIVEDAVLGPGRLVPKPIRTLGLLVRNDETLDRLAFLAEGGAGR